jgi:uncharacterized linocin/CFP29 family protein
MEILNQTNLPFGNGVWQVLQSEISEKLSKRLTLRGVVDFKDEYTFDTDSISTKNINTISSKKGLEISTRESIKMIEMKKTFKIPMSVIKDIKRSKPDFDDKSIVEAVNSFSEAENLTILHGSKEANIVGILSSVETTLEAKGAKDLLACVAKSMGEFNKNFVDGPFKLIVSNATLAKLYTESFDGVSLKSKIDEVIGSGSIVVNTEIGDDQALVVSQRGGDYEFYSGLDVSLGYESDNSKEVELFLIETFAFRNISPEASVLIKIK